MSTTVEYLESAKFRYIAAAKTEQVVKELEAKGYQIELDALAGEDPHAPRFDILARRGDELLVVEVKVFGQSQPSAAQIASLRKLARTQGINEFQVVIAHPPQVVLAEVEGLDHAIEEYLSEHTPQAILDISPHAVIEEVHDVDLGEIKVGEDGTNVVGDGLVRVNLALGGGETRDGVDIHETFPLRFSLTLDGARRIVAAVIEVDTSSWSD